MRTYENYANIPLCYSIDSFHNSQRVHPLDPQKAKGIIMSKFTVLGDMIFKVDDIVKIVCDEEAKHIKVDTIHKGVFIAKSFDSDEDYNYAYQLLTKNLDLQTF